MRYIDITTLMQKRRRWGNGQELWKNGNLKEDFRNHFFGKCWYTEVSLAGHDEHIDHFRPKAEVKPYKDYNFNRPLQTTGYYWLKNSPENYRASCAYANRLTDGGGKSSFFPLANDSNYLTPAGNEQEQALLLDPCCEEDVQLISFIGNKVISSSNVPEDQARVEVSVHLYNLDNSFIKAARRKVWDEIEKTLAEYQFGDINKTACLRRLRDSISIESPFSACAIACVNSLATDEIKSELDLRL